MWVVITLGEPGRGQVDDEAPDAGYPMAGGV
jgi:hypothetical protein